nr:immunoglobulin light chain junction region [Macaca mulatta]
CHNYYSAPHSF